MRSIIININLYPSIVSSLIKRKMLTYIIIAIVIICVIIYLYNIIKKVYDYDLFNRQGIKYIKPFPLIGSVLDTYKGIGIAERVLSYYKRFPNEKIFGFYELHVPVYVLRCPQVIKQITIKDFPYFQDRFPLIDPSLDEYLGNMLFSMQGKEWRDMRAALSPLFTGSKMRRMLQFMIKCTEQMMDHIRKDYKANGLKPLDIKDLFYCYTNDVMATCAFGVECDSFKNPNNEIFKIGFDLLQFQKKINVPKFLMMRYFTKLSKLLGLEVISMKTKKKFADIILHTIEVRERENIIRPDMLQLLMKLRNNQEEQIMEDEIDEIEKERKLLNADIKRTWSDKELLAQCFVFFVAGFENNAKLMSMIAHELAVNTECQDKLIKEIDEENLALAGKPLTYETLQRMKYLDAVITEGLRKWPQNIATDRMCVKDYIYEDNDGLKFTIRKGTIIWIPIIGLHMDPNYFPNPDKFDPERFIDESKAHPDFNTQLSFGIGPRNCIGSRFALLELKVLFFQLLLHFKIKVCEETDIPIKLKKSIMGLVPNKEIKLYIEPRA